MNLSQNLDLTLKQTLPSLSQFSELIDLNWIEDCLDQTGKASIRKRKLPAEHVVWLVIGLALFRNQPIWYVVQQLTCFRYGRILCTECIRTSKTALRLRTHECFIFDIKSGMV